MKKEDLFRAMNDIDDDLLLQSEKKKLIFISLKAKAGFAFVALACCLLVVGLNMNTSNVPTPVDPDPQPIVPPKEEPDDEVIIPNYPDYINPFVTPFVKPNYNEQQLVYNPSLPKIGLTFEKGGMGCIIDGEEIKDFTLERLSKNTWNESITYKELPVYKNYQEISVDMLKNIMMEVAGQIKMNITQDDIVVKSDETHEQYGAKYYSIFLEAEDENYLLTVDGTDRMGISVQIELKNPIQIPKGLLVDENESIRNVNNYGNYYKDKIATTFDLEDPQIRIYDGYYDIEGKLGGYNLSYIEGNANIFDEMSKSIDVHTCDDGKSIWMIKVNYQKNLDTLGNYPVISVGKAKALLLEGKYLTYNPKPILTEDNILKVEMLYRHTIASDAIVPFYKFYVKSENQKESEKGFITVGQYYVPAIEEQYLENQKYWEDNIYE